MALSSSEDVNRLGLGLWPERVEEHQRGSGSPPRRANTFAVGERGTPGPKWPSGKPCTDWACGSASSDGSRRVARPTSCSPGTESPSSSTAVSGTAARSAAPTSSRGPTRTSGGRRSRRTGSGTAATPQRPRQPVGPWCGSGSARSAATPRAPLGEWRPWPANRDRVAASARVAQRIKVRGPDGNPGRSRRGDPPGHADGSTHQTACSCGAGVGVRAQDPEPRRRPQIAAMPRARAPSVIIGP